MVAIITVTPTPSSFPGMRRRSAERLDFLEVASGRLEHPGPVSSGSRAVDHDQ